MNCIYVWMHCAIFMLLKQLFVVREKLFLSLWSLASPAFRFLDEILPNFALGNGCRVGWARHTKTLLDVFLLASNLAIWFNQEEETATGASTGVDDSVTTRKRGDYSISSLTWASCVAYPFWLAAKAWCWDEQEYNSHVFFLYPFGLGLLPGIDTITDGL